uniref:Expansin-like EG45 domain-containing protein n=1 Tax=Opuntia streptacantha TaxID=393608 RepID=A0A7C8YU67_OPUST
MAALVRAMILAVIFASFASVAFSISGVATYYTQYYPSSCYGNENQGTMIAAVSADIFQNKAACGRMYRVTCVRGTNLGVAQPCKGGSVTVKVVDLCPGCSANGFDLSQEAFAAIADPAEGKIIIDYEQV